MANSLTSIEQLAADFDAMCIRESLDPRTVFEVMAYAVACAEDEDEQRQVREIVGLEEE